MASGFTEKYHAFIHGLRRAFQPGDYRASLRRLTAAEENIRRLTALQYGSVVNSTNVKDLLRGRELKIHSQYGEDGILLHLFSKIGASTHKFVEFGVQDGRQCCSANLLQNFGWSGLMIEGNPVDAAAIEQFYFGERGLDRKHLTVVHSFVTAENINSLIAHSGLTGEIDLLSIDVDGNDYWIWKALDVVKPRVVVIEYNASLPAERPLVIRYDPQFVRAAGEPQSFYHGASLAALDGLAARKGYYLACCDSSGVNAFFVRNDLRPADLPVLTPAEAYYPLAARSRFGPPASQFAAVQSMAFESDGLSAST